ncbi:hypothetical protein NPIL_539011 [Nephila pilipes]|uniref:Uncharacterized protein n=1 Tax=Nephila pilipes TaxID=299642 RepID=A0A8X6NYV3_NEPPI|nr:hypothetical protein NPIL_539011 [Nephila pilipes]
MESAGNAQNVNMGSPKLDILPDEDYFVKFDERSPTMMQLSLVSSFQSLFGNIITCLKMTPLLTQVILASIFVIFALNKDGDAFILRRSPKRCNSMEKL